LCRLSRHVSPSINHKAIAAGGGVRIGVPDTLTGRPSPRRGAAEADGHRRGKDTRPQQRVRAHPEQPNELSLLRSEQCDGGQGFLFARPLDAAATETFLERWAADAIAPVGPRLGAS
jgi:hypothetical protein